MVDSSRHPQEVKRVVHGHQYSDPPYPTTKSRNNYHFTSRLPFSAMISLAWTDGHGTLVTIQPIAYNSSWRRLPLASSVWTVASSGDLGSCLKLGFLPCSWDEGGSSLRFTMLVGHPPQIPHATCVAQMRKTSPLLFLNVWSSWRYGDRFMSPGWTHHHPTPYGVRYVHCAVMATKAGDLHWWAFWWSPGLYVFSVNTPSSRGWGFG